MGKKDQPSVLSYVPQPNPARETRGAKRWVLALIGWVLVIFGGFGTLLTTAETVYVFVFLKRDQAAGRIGAVHPSVYQSLVIESAIYVSLLLLGLWTLRRRPKQESNEQLTNKE